MHAAGESHALARSRTRPHAHVHPQARNIATDALVLGKKVAIAYEPGKVLITVYERDGSQHNSSLKWA